ncbi:protein kinase [Streptomyces sp. RKAG290]|uniref:serine/threonine-protein kinase n=1 Tax=Streptomyces sp. RKAG290 TaxID=2888348 RepID=UPI002033FAAF|nr:serine/threonine-protein kinase [Streptomyces sp. RKAG290]MCM2411642.1 serine/threonine-protein kinase [Streptomyces sp. RKAG290]
MIELLPAGRARLIGPYQLLGLLGAGGMGEVYLARPAGAAGTSGELVALKTVRADLDLDDGFRVRFRREIDAAAAVRSPHTAGLVDGDPGGRLPWLATEYVPGPSLAEALAGSGPLPEPVVRAMGAGLSHALADMHAVRVLHRDLKPGNVLLGPDGPKVIDFGIAQAFDATQLTRTGVVVGSPGYISPEHVNGSRSLVPASDVFCLGAVLAFAATGRGPFDDSDMAAVIFRISRGEAELSGVPAQLRTVIEKCLRGDAAARPTPLQLADLLLPERVTPARASFPWTDAIRAQLAAHAAAARSAEAAAPSAVVPPLPFHAPVLGGQGLGPSPVVPVTVPVGRKSGKGRWIGLAAATVVCVILGSTLLPGLFTADNGGGDDAGGGAKKPTASASEAVRTESGAVVAPGADPGRTGDFGAAAADVSTKPAGWRAWHTKIADGRVECVLAGVSLVCGGPQRITVLDAATGKQRWRTSMGRAGAASPSVGAVVGTTVYAFEGGALVARDLSDGAEKWRAPLPDGVRVADSVQSGDVLYYATKHTGTGAGRLIAQELTGKHLQAWDEAWQERADEAELVLDDGRLVAVGEGVTVLKSTDGSRLAGIPAGDVTCRTPVLKGQQLLCSGSDGLTIVNVTDPQKRRIAAPGVNIAYRPAVSRDGLVVVSSKTQVFTLGLYDGQMRWATCECGEGLETSGVPSIVGDNAIVVEGYGPGAIPMATEGEPRPTGAALNGWPAEPGDSLDPASVSLIAQGDALILSFEDGTVLSAYAP